MRWSGGGQAAALAFRQPPAATQSETFARSVFPSGLRSRNVSAGFRRRAADAQPPSPACRRKPAGHDDRERVALRCCFMSQSLCRVPPRPQRSVRPINRREPAAFLRGQNSKRNLRPTHLSPAPPPAISRRNSKRNLIQSALAGLSPQACRGMMTESALPYAVVLRRSLSAQAPCTLNHNLSCLIVLRRSLTPHAAAPPTPSPSSPTCCRKPVGVG